MKTKIIFTMLVLFKSFFCLAQDENDVINVGNESYIFTKPVLIYKCANLDCKKITDTHYNERRCKI